jgi:hypothetical protein
LPVFIGEFIDVHITGRLSEPLLWELPLPEPITPDQPAVITPIRLAIESV